MLNIVEIINSREPAWGVFAEFAQRRKLRRYQQLASVNRKKQLDYEELIDIFSDVKKSWLHRANEWITPSYFEL